MTGISEDGNRALTKEFLAERDLRILRLRQTGLSHETIARQFGITTQAVTNAITRQLQKLNQQTLQTYPEILRLELERLDQLQANIWTQAQHRTQTLDDGTKINLEPDLKAIQTILQIQNQRAKLLGLTPERIIQHIDISATMDIQHTLQGTQNPQTQQTDTRAETLKILEIMQQTGTLHPETTRQLINQLQTPQSEQELEDLEEATLIEPPEETTLIQPTTQTGEYSSSSPEPRNPQGPEPRNPQRERQP